MSLSAQSKMMSTKARKTAETRHTRRQAKRELRRIAPEQIHEMNDERREAESALLEQLFADDYRWAFTSMMELERKQVLEGFDPHRDEPITTLERFDELISDYIADLGPLTLAQSQQRTNMRIVIADQFALV